MSEFPAVIIPNNTQTLLELRPECDRRSIRLQLKELDPTVILFLQKLRHVTIEVAGELCRTFEKNEQTNGLTTITETCAIQGQEPFKKILEFHVTQQVKTAMTKDAKRGGTTTTKIVLAFPLQNGRPHLATQQVHAFLLLSDLGFKVNGQNFQKSATADIANFDTGLVSNSSRFPVNC